MWESRYYVTLNITVDGCDTNLTLNITVDGCDANLTLNITVDR